MKKSPSNLSAKAREQVCDALRVVLTDGLDLHSQIKVAHWNIKGPQFAALHPLFDTFASDLGNENDTVAERILTLGGLAVGTARHVAKNSNLPDYPQDVTAAMEHVALLADRIGKYLETVRDARDEAEKAGDDDTVDVLTGTATMFEKHAWFLHASLEK